MDSLESLAQELQVGRLNRREFIGRAAALGLSATAIGALLAACGGEASSTGPSPTPLDTTKPDKLYLFNWQNEIAPENKKKFRERTGIEIVETFFDDNEALIAKLKAGARGYDIVVPSDYAVSVLSKTGLLQPLHMDYIPNFKNVIQSLAHPEYDLGTGGKKYSVPYVWGTTGVAIRTDKVAEARETWEVLWDPKYKNMIDMLNDERETIGVALRLLGYSVNTASTSEVDAAADKLIEQKPLVRAYDSLNMKRNIVSGVPLVHTWDGDCLLAVQAVGKEKVRYLLPTEGFTLWVDNLCIPVGARSPYAGHLFMDFMCEPENAAALVNFTRYQSPNASAKPLIDPAILAVAPNDEQLKYGQIQKDLGAFGTYWTQTWERVKSA